MESEMIHLACPNCDSADNLRLVPCGVLFFSRKQVVCSCGKYGSYPQDDETPWDAWNKMVWNHKENHK